MAHGHKRSESISKEYYHLFVHLKHARFLMTIEGASKALRCWQSKLLALDKPRFLVNMFII